MYTAAHITRQLLVYLSTVNLFTCLLSTCLLVYLSARQLNSFSPGSKLSSHDC